MRITNMLRYNRSLDTLERRNSSMSQAHMELSTGRRVSRISDDPVAGARVLRLNSEISLIVQHQRNLDSARTLLSTTEQSLAGIGDLLSEARGLALQGSGNTLSQPDRMIVADQVDQVLERMIAEGNRHFLGRSIFGGSRTDQDPFIVNTDENGEVFSVQANPEGMQGRVTREVNEGENIEVSLPGQAIFMSGGARSETDMFDLLISLRNGLRSDPDFDSGNLLGRIDTLVDQTAVERSAVGQKLMRLESIEVNLLDREVELSDSLSLTRDVDLAKATARWAMEQTAYEAALRTTASVMSQSLMDFLG
ncbi:MAG: flagellar hook-associated protein FlgL [Calditrichaeota bacterium]|nr:flagellar hook-associated protein FlgL [Candidatus Cloacimonadota bacterium]MCA9787929.1 flagellar hook-associated protein FlgL [Candidatus Cloacimonadota bacterium]MCB1047337.1 flagellar hook-associated protein FlgL [Calditrichota bacterium]MCB9474013.1 flagellar hook-associated protein FlgL [Candidatus Delongbacteria bacterium]